LLFFGWVTGVQLLFATYNMRSENPWRLVTLIVFSFTVVVIGYTLISHAFTQFLYPEAGFIGKLYDAAHIDLTWFNALIVLVALVIVLGWLSAYYADRHAAQGKSFGTRLWMSFYALLMREFYVADLYAALTRGLLAGSARVNSWLRWG
jgi:NADH-quinone oxidoreductase subunit L